MEAGGILVELDESAEGFFGVGGGDGGLDEDFFGWGREGGDHFGASGFEGGDDGRGFDGLRTEVHGLRMIIFWPKSKVSVGTYANWLLSVLVSLDRPWAWRTFVLKI